MKLTKTMKKEIELSILRQKINPQEKSIDEKTRKLFLQLVEEKIKPFKKAIDIAPKGLLYYEDSACVRYGKTYQEKIYIALEKDIFVPFAWCGGKRCERITLDVSEDPKWKKIFSDIDKEKQDLSKYKEELRRELNGFLAGISTDSKLFKTFPEISEYIDMSKYAFYSVMVQPDNLKKLLNR